MKRHVVIISGKNPLHKSGGYAQYSYSLSKILTSLGYKVNIYCLGRKNDLIQSDIGVIHIVRSRLISLPLLRNNEMLGLFFMAPQLTLALKKDLHDASQLYWGIGPWTLAGTLLKIISPGKKIELIADYFTSIKHEYKGALQGVNIADYGIIWKINLMIGYVTLIQLYSLLEKLLLSLSNKIVCHYSSTQLILKKEFNLPDKKFTRLPYYIFSQNHSQKRKLHRRQPHVLLICRHDPRKGINYLLHAFAALNKKSLPYKALLVGTGKLLHKHQQLANKLHLTNVAFAGFLPNIQNQLNQADVYVFPTFEEGSSAISLLEAMRYGLPIVSTDVDGIPEDLEDKKSALLVKPGNPQAIADAMETLLTRQTYALNLGNQAKKQFERKFNLKNVRTSIKVFLESR